MQGSKEQIQGDSVEYFIRTQSDRPYTYGVGEVILPGISLFRSGEYNLSLTEAEALLARKQKAGK
jgi:hypothetical protein